jgi:hypothetical protein
MHGYDGSTAPAGGPERRGFVGYALRSRWPVVFAAAWVLLAAVNIGLLITSSRTLHAIAGDTATQQPARTTPSHQAAPSASASPAISSHLLGSASAAAFGPDGTADGDGAGSAAAAIDSSQTTAWTTSWYRTARFGDLKKGTGLLLDLGTTATVAGVRILLGPARGADVQVMSGDAASRTALAPQASATDAGGLVQLAFPHPERARYVLIWFTRLPPDKAGTYQVSVYDVQIQGTR